MTTTGAMTAGGRPGAVNRLRVDLRLAFRLHRFELVGFGIVIVFLAAAGIGVAGLLDATGYGVSCDPTGVFSPACEAMANRFYDLQSSVVPMVQALLMASSYLLALVVGPVLVARELERGTGRLAWSLAPSRVRWFLARLLPVTAAVFLLALIAGVALDRVNAALNPWTDNWQSFDAFGSRGIVFAARVTFAFAIGVAAGAHFARTLPALLIAAVVACVAIAGGAYVHGRWLGTEAILVSDNNGAGVRGALFVDQRIKDPSGRILGWDEAYALIPQDANTTDWPPAGWSMVDLVVPGDRYPFAQAREIVALGGASLVFLGAAALSVRRKRPG
jgi:hypothetical protein